MLKYQNLTIVGTSHVAIESVKEVKKVILKQKPKVVAIELDKKRMPSLLSKRKRRLRIHDIKKVGIKGFLFNLIGVYVEKKLGKLVGSTPGAEMKSAVQCAKEIKAKIALIDQDIDVTLKKLSNRITTKEKIRFITELLKGMILRKPKINFDLRKVPEENIIKTLTSKVKKEYPSIYEVLIKERNEIMAKGLYKIMKEHKKDRIVAVMGAGHEKGVMNLIKKEKW